MRKVAFLALAAVLSDCALNGCNRDTADASCDIPPDTWLAQVFSDELRASGSTKETLRVSSLAAR